VNVWEMTLATGRKVYTTDPRAIERTAPVQHRRMFMDRCGAPMTVAGVPYCCHVIDPCELHYATRCVVCNAPAPVDRCQAVQPAMVQGAEQQTCGAPLCAAHAGFCRDHGG
jgi:hypothetical protein